MPLHLGDALFGYNQRRIFYRVLLVGLPRMRYKSHLLT